MLLEELEPLPGYLQYRHGSKVIIKIIDIVPYIDVLRYILPLFQLSGKCLFFCIFTVYPAEREVYGADNYSCIGRQLFVCDLLRSQIRSCKEEMPGKSLG